MRIASMYPLRNPPLTAWVFLGVPQYYAWVEWGRKDCFAFASYKQCT